MRDLLNLLNDDKPVDESILDPNTADLDDTVPDRLKGPGARAAKTQIEPKTDAATLGRERRR